MPKSIVHFLVHHEYIFLSMYFLCSKRSTIIRSYDNKFCRAEEI